MNNLKITLIRYCQNISTDLKKGYQAWRWWWSRGGGGETVPATRLTDLSKAFDCLPHDVSIAKPNAYGIKKEKGL